jgi:hypothetical protein
MSARTDCSALRSWVKPMMALSANTAAMTPASMNSSSTSVTSVAARRM